MQSNTPSSRAKWRQVHSGTNRQFPSVSSNFMVLKVVLIRIRFNLVTSKVFMIVIKISLNKQDLYNKQKLSLSFETFLLSVPLSILDPLCLYHPH